MIFTFGCKNQISDPGKLLLMITSKGDKKNILATILIINKEGIEEKLNVDSNLNYNYKILYYSKDGFSTLACCEFGEVNGLNDIEKVMKTYTNKEFDSLSNIYDEKQSLFFKDLQQVFESDKGFKIDVDNLVVDVFEANDLDYCECNYLKENGFVLPKGIEAFITNLGMLKTPDTQQEKFIVDNLEDILSIKNIKNVINN